MRCPFIQGCPLFIRGSTALLFLFILFHTLKTISTDLMHSNVYMYIYIHYCYFTSVGSSLAFISLVIVTISSFFIGRSLGTLSMKAVGNIPLDEPIIPYIHSSLIRCVTVIISLAYGPEIIIDKS